MLRFHIILEKIGLELYVVNEVKGGCCVKEWEFELRP